MRDLSKYLPKVCLPVVLLAAGGMSAATAREISAAPPNAPAKVDWNKAEGRLILRYHNRVILDATVRPEDAAGKKAPGAVELKPSVAGNDGDKVEQRLRFTLSGAGKGVEPVLRGTIHGSREAFPAEASREAQERFDCVRTSVGLSRSLRNHAVYDRRWDWVLVGPGGRATRLDPSRPGEGGVAVSCESRGSDGTLEIVFRPRFYQRYKGLDYYAPWTYDVWKESVTGYCTWWPYRGGFNQRVLDEVVDVFTEKRLPDFGYKYFQIDDCFQTGGGSPDGFLNWNNKFPGGAKYLVEKVRSAGMEAGVWTFCVLYESDPKIRKMVEEHPEWFVRGPDGKVKRTVNPWSGAGFYALDTTNPEAVAQVVRPTYRGLAKLGFSYVKIDGAGDLVDWAYRKSADYFRGRNATPGDALRAFYEAAREELGDDVYLLTCWGVMPDLVGVADGCRLATDGFRASSFQGFSSWEGVVWRNDPDHCDVLPHGREDQPVMKTFAAEAAPLDTIIRPAVISLAGGVLMLSDKAEVYRDDNNLEGAKRSSPVLFTVPGQLQDHTPRGPDWSFHKDFRDYVRGGGGEAPWWLQEIDRPFDHWSVLARFNWQDKKAKGKRRAPEQVVKFAGLGLPDDREYLVFEFWTQKFLGKAKGSFTAPAMDENTAMHVFAIREARSHPWVLSTTRHLSQGGVSLRDEKWNAATGTLSGESAVVAGDPYVLTVHLPDGSRLKSAKVAGRKAEIKNEGETATVRIVPPATATVKWEMTFDN